MYLKKLLNDEIRFISKKNLVQGKSFMEMLDRTIKRYTNKSVEAAQVIEELIELARKVREEKNRGIFLGISAGLRRCGLPRPPDLPRVHAPLLILA
jgi:type I restriction enzyme R subunit